MAGESVVFNMKPMQLRLAALPGIIDTAVQATMEHHAPDVASYAKTHAVWEDQTGNARNGLDAVAYKEGDEHGIVLFHQVPYGIWLEVRWDGKLAIINPTIAAMGPEIMKTLSSLMRRL